MLPVELLESFQRRDAILFIGAGLSVGAGLPGWADLIRPLAQSVGSRWPANETDLTTDHLLIAAQHYENHCLEPRMRAGLKGILVRTGKFRETDLQLGIEPDGVIDSIADLVECV